MFPGARYRSCTDVASFPALSWVPRASWCGDNEYTRRYEKVPATAATSFTIGEINYIGRLRTCCRIKFKRIKVRCELNEHERFFFSPLFLFMLTHLSQIANNLNIDRNNYCLHESRSGKVPRDCPTLIALSSSVRSARTDLQSDLNTIL